MLIDVETGARLHLAGHCKVRPVANGILVASRSSWVFVPAIGRCVITDDLAVQLVQAGLAIREGEGVFENEALSTAIFSWSPDVEVDGLLSVLPPDALCLDVGCGFGRLLRPLVDANRSVVGVDRSVTAVTSLVRDGYNAICAPIEDFCRPGFDCAFAALNTLRYLETWFAWNRHFRLMRQNLKPGGRYVVNLSLVEEPNQVSPLSWAFDYKAAPHSVAWQVSGFDRLDEVIVECVKIIHAASAAVVHEEYQIQLWITPNGLSHWLSMNCQDWRLVRVWDNAWIRLDHGAVLPGGATYWLELEALC